MLTPDQRHWCLEQAIEIIKLAPSDALPTHDRLKRVYKRLMSLMEDVEAKPDPAKLVRDNGKDSSKTVKKG